MARQPVEQVQCDRCKRVEVQPVSPIPKNSAEFRAVLGTEELVYNDLCTHCRSAIGRLFKLMSEWERELSQSLIGPSVPNNQAPPVQSAPDYSPPKPHSK